MKMCIGIDEVGRGPLAGPVAVCAFKIRSADLKIKEFKFPLRDSKKLSRIRRELWFKQIKIWQKEGKCDFSVVMISASVIDSIGISYAIRCALTRALANIESDTKTLILLDGGLKAPQEFKNQKTIIKGDEKESAISLASICAKVTRDRYMQNQAKKYPQYGFERHVGYGTDEHYKAIKKYGLTKLHRCSYLHL